MKRIPMAAKAACIGLALAASSLGTASADTLYVSAPPPAAPGHPMRLGADHRASQIGDLVSVLFNFNETDASSQSVTNAKQYSISLGNNNGHFNIGFLNIPTAGQASSGSTSSHSRTGATTFSSTMMAMVTNVYPSGALEVAGSQTMTVNGVNEKLLVTGLIRPEDVDNTDTVSSTRIANVQARWDGNFQDPHEGLLRKILNVLF